MIADNCPLKAVRITAVRQVEHHDLMQQWENPLPEACEVRVGQTFVSHDAQCPSGLCASAWQTMQPFVLELARGGGNFYEGWMKNPHTALLSCNDGFRPMSFFLETIED